MLKKIRTITALLAFVIVFTDMPVIPGGYSLSESISEAQDPPRRRRGTSSPGSSSRTGTGAGEEGDRCRGLGG
ncbi:MAG: hypothetical protein ACJ0DK_11210 [Planctomycetota bacterium]